MAKKYEEIVKELASLVAEPITVDGDSLQGDGPARIEVNYRDPAKLRIFMEVFFNSVGYGMRFVAEGRPGRNQGGGQGEPPATQMATRTKVGRRKREMARIDKTKHFRESK